MYTGNMQNKNNDYVFEKSRIVFIYIINNVHN